MVKVLKTYRAFTFSVIPEKSDWESNMRAFFLAIGLVIASPAIGQQPALRSIQDTVVSMTDEKLVNPYIYSRCAGVFDGVRGYGGGNLPVEVNDSFDEMGKIFTFAASVEKQQNAVATGIGPTELDPHMMQAFLDVERFEKLYIERFRSNYELGGSMLENDVISQGDITFCRETFPAANDLVSKTLEIED